MKDLFLLFEYVFAYIHVCALALYTIQNVFLPSKKKKMERLKLQEKVVFLWIGNGELQNFLS